MKNKYLVLAGNNKLEKVDNTLFLFPLKGYCVGMSHEYAIQEIPKGSYVYVNRLFDSSLMNSFIELYPSILKCAQGIVFEDLGVLEVLKEKNSHLKTILYATHAVCSLETTLAYLSYVDSVILSPDITLEEIKYISSQAKVGAVLFGHLPLMYSRRQLVTNYARHFGVEKTNPFLIKEPIHNKEFLLVENEYGTVLYDNAVYNGYELLDCPCEYYLLNLEFTQIEHFSEWLKEFEAGQYPSTSSFFLHQETIYRLPPKEERHD